MTDILAEPENMALIEQARHTIDALRARTKEDIDRQEREVPQGVAPELWRRYIGIQRHIFEGQFDERLVEEAQQLSAEIVAQKQAPQDTNAVSAEFDREVNELDNLLSHRPNDSSFAWYREEERTHWTNLKAQADAHISSQALAMNEQLRKAKDLLNLRVQAFTDIAAREQLRSVSVQEARATLKILINALAAQSTREAA